jgi:hypothetical protein
MWATPANAIVTFFFSSAKTEGAAAATSVAAVACWINSRRLGLARAGSCLVGGISTRWLRIPRSMPTRNRDPRQATGASHYLSGRTETPRNSQPGTATLPARSHDSSARQGAVREVDRVEESGRGQPHSRTWRTQFDPVPRGSVLECGLGQSGSDLCRFVSRRLTGSGTHAARIRGFGPRDPVSWHCPPRLRVPAEPRPSFKN